MEIKVNAKPFNYQLEISDKLIQNVFLIVGGTIVLKRALKLFK